MRGIDQRATAVNDTGPGDVGIGRDDRADEGPAEGQGRQGSGAASPAARSDPDGPFTETVAPIAEPQPTSTAAS
ncbi:MAG: hypothetical protein ABI382_11870 [Nakamurella sp.]